MLRGVRSREELAQFAISRRLQARIGALLAKSVEVTGAVLEAAPPGSTLESLLLSGKLLKEAPDLTPDRIGEIAGERGIRMQELPAISVAEGEGGRKVLCLEEEILADKALRDGGGGTAAEGVGAGGAPLTVIPSPGEIVGVPPWRGGAAGGTAGSGAVMSAAEIARVRLRLATSADTKERIECLRTLACAPITNAEKADHLLRSLYDGDPAVRSEAAKLLAVLGLTADLAEALADLSSPDARQRGLALEKALRIAGKGREFDDSCCALTILAALRSESERNLRARMLEALRPLAGVLTRRPEYTRETVRRLVDLVAAARAHDPLDASLFAPGRLLVRALLSRDTAACEAALWEEYEKSASPYATAFVLLHLLESYEKAPDLQRSADRGLPRLLELSARFIASDREEGRDSRMVGGTMTRIGDAAIPPLCEVFSKAAPGAQKHILRLMDEICRYRKTSTENKARAARVMLTCLEGGQKSLRMAAMECYLCGDPDLPDDLKGRLAAEMIRHVSDFAFRPDIERVEGTIARTGLPAVEHLLALLDRRLPMADRARGCRIIGELFLHLKVRAPDRAKASARLDDAVRALMRLVMEDAEIASSEEPWTALGRICASPLVSRETFELVSRRLLEAHGRPELAKATLDGLAWMASGRKCRREKSHAVIRELRLALDSVPAELQVETVNRDGETVFSLDRNVEEYTKIIPVAVRGLARIIAAGTAGEAAARDATMYLIGLWKKILAGELIWGPANSAVLTEALREAGCAPAIPPAMRGEIIRALGPRIYQIPVMLAIAEILGRNDSSDLAPLAVAAAHAILKHYHKEEGYDAEDREHVLKALYLIGRRKELAAAKSSAEEIMTLRRRILDDLMAGLKDGVTGCYNHLVALRDRDPVPDEIKSEVERRLAEYHSLAAI
ncbi:MAG: hypothetical protein N3A38_09980 [Planctomycetota bacterium]|nr:hypothetical protein [Planctomycetota bacterium]